MHLLLSTIKIYYILIIIKALVSWIEQKSSRIKYLDCKSNKNKYIGLDQILINTFSSEFNLICIVFPIIFYYYIFD